LFLVVGALDINQVHRQRTAGVVNDVCVFLVVLVTAANVVISVFEIQHVDHVVFNASTTSLP